MNDLDNHLDYENSTEDMDYLFQRIIPLSWKIFVKDIEIKKGGFILTSFILISLSFQLYSQTGLDAQITQLERRYTAFSTIAIGLVLGILVSIVILDKIRKLIEFVKFILIVSLSLMFFEIIFISIGLFFDVRGQKEIRTIDHGDRKIIYKTNSSKDVVFALLVREELIVLRRKLDSLIEDFDKYYLRAVKEIDNIGMDMDLFKNLKYIVRRYFGY
ncbi:MAG: hypothetical protein ACTSR8_19705 [Promethearchaeota archaeon]